MIEELLLNWLKADSEVYSIKEQIKEMQTKLVLAETNSAEAAVQAKDYMNHNGLVEDTVKGEFIDYKIYFTTPRESVKVLDGVPDEFCKIERKPDLKKIKSFIDEGNTPNWATLQLGESNLTYKSVTRK